ncbi:MAG: alpha/beta hydrolase, partial [Clostridiales bacterium]|nr:alpha/beta hydrolase [Clostridiales bacterium]
DSERCKKITIPVLVCKAQVDKSVYGEKEDEFVNLLPNGRLVQFEGSRHEIYASGDETLLKYYQTIESFLDE